MYFENVLGLCLVSLLGTRLYKLSPLPSSPPLPPKKNMAEPVFTNVNKESESGLEFLFLHLLFHPWPECLVPSSVQ